MHSGIKVEEYNRKYSEFNSMKQYRDRLSRYQLMPLKDFHFNRSLYIINSDSETLHQGSVSNVLTLFIVGILILLVGLFNFVNIYTLIILKRSREFGVKKVYGAKGIQIFSQLYLENFSLTAVSVFGAWLLLEISEKLLINNIGFVVQDNIRFNVAFSLTMLFVLPFITTIYPYLRYNYSSPVTSLRSVNRGGVSLVSRTIFLFLQYVITFALIVISLYFMKQLNFMLQSDAGYDTENIIVTKLLYQDNSHHIKSEAESKKSSDKFKRNIEVIERKMDTSPLFQNWSFGKPHYTIEPHLSVGVDGRENHSVGMLYASRKQLKLLNIQLVEGRLWDSTDVGTQYRFIINETAKKLFNITDIHSTYLQPEHRLWHSIEYDTSTNPAYEIVGVVKDFKTGHLSKPIVPMIIIYQDDNEPDEYIMAKIATYNRNEAIEYIKNLNHDLYGNADFTYSFVEDDITALYEEDKRISHVYTIFSIIAILISCLGLFALSVFDIRQRYREIALRKINGATAKDIMQLLLKKYIRLLTGAFIVAIPLSFLIINKYMENFAHKTALSWWLFAISAITVSAISLFTLIWQINKAIKINPTEGLNDE